MHVGRRFEHLLDSHRRQDGRQWTGQQVGEATGGVVLRYYVVDRGEPPLLNAGLLEGLREATTRECRIFLGIVRRFGGGVCRRAAGSGWGAELGDAT